MRQIFCEQEFVSGPNNFLLATAVPEDLPFSWHVAAAAKLAGLWAELSHSTGKSLHDRGVS